MDASAGLAALAADVARAFRYLGDDPPDWVPARPGIDHDVVVVGGGQSGCAVAFALRRAGIVDTLVVDGAPPGKAGTWVRHARMRTLRTPKTIPGPELGIPQLSFPAWYEAQHGRGAFAAIGRIALQDWAAYIEWFRQMAKVNVQHGTAALAVGPEGDHLRIDVMRDGAQQTVRTRKVVLAMGMTGAGVPAIPAVIAQGLSPSRYAHTDDTIDFQALRGRRVAVLGAASSAFDAAGLALETGAASVHLFCRGADLARVAREWPLGYPGAGNNFGSLSDADRWMLGRILRARAPGPMPETVRRATTFDRFRLHLGATVEAAVETDDGCVLTVDGRQHAFDFVIAGTGYEIDPAAQPVLSGVASHIATWGDRYVPPPALRHEAGARYPYLGDGYEFLERLPSTAPWVRDIHCFNFAAIMSYGRTVGDIGSLANGVPRLVSAMSRDLFLADRDHHLTRLTAPPPMELTGDEYAHAVWKKPACVN